MIVYLPILTLQGIEGKLFRPMALTVVFALAGSMVLSLTLMPVLASLGLSRKTPDKETLVDRLRPLALPAAAAPGPAVPLDDAGLRRARSRWPRRSWASRLGSEFVPRLERGDDRHQHDPPGQRQPGGVARLRHADRGDPEGGVPRRDRPDLEPDRHRRGGHRPDGLRGVRRLRHAQAPRAAGSGRRRRRSSSRRWPR